MLRYLIDLCIVRIKQIDPHNDIYELSVECSCIENLFFMSYNHYII